MTSLRLLFVLTVALALVGLLVIAAFYGIVPGYGPIYAVTLAIALVAGLIAWRKRNDPVLRGPAGAILTSSVMYWVLGGAALPSWANGVALFVVAGSTIAGCVGLYRSMPVRSGAADGRTD